MTRTSRHAGRKISIRIAYWRRKVCHMLGGEGHNDPIVKIFDLSLVALITVNCLFSILETVDQLSILHGHIFRAFDHFSVMVFTIEYVLRLWSAVDLKNPSFRRPILGRLRYMFTPMALVDLMSILPFYLDMLVGVDLRAMRVLRLIRVFKLTRYSNAMRVLLDVLHREARVLSALLFIFIVMLVFISSVMYLFEHPYQPEVFSDIPAAMWWTVVTMTTLGYGDMVPISVMGRIVGACTAILGVGMIALPAGVLASGFNEAIRRRREEYLSAMEKATMDRRRLTARERRDLEDTRIDLGLSQKEAADLLKRAFEGRLGAARLPTRCPHCGEELE